MKIEEAIEQLQRQKEAGTKSIVFAFWEAEMFDLEDDASWEDMAATAENKMDWSNTHQQLDEIINLQNQ